jgi:hypothetical protein
MCPSFSLILLAGTFEYAPEGTLLRANVRYDELAHLTITYHVYRSLGID